MNYKYSVKLTFQLCILISVLADARPKGKTCKGEYPDADRQNHVAIKCGEMNLTSYKVGEYHYCCGCAAGFHVDDDCGCSDQYTTVCKPCPDNSFTAEVNVQRTCTISMPPTYCDKLQFTQYVKGNKTSDGRCECVPGTYALEPMINGCKKHSMGCAENFVIASFGNSTHDIQCKPCEIGYCTSGYGWALECRLPPCTDKTNSTKKAEEISDKANPSDTTAKTSTSPRITTAPTKGTPVVETSTLSAWIWIGIVVVIGVVSTMLVVFCCPCHKGCRRRKSWVLDECLSREKDSAGPEADIRMDDINSVSTQKRNRKSRHQAASNNRHSNSSVQGTIADSGIITGSSSFLASSAASSPASNQKSPMQRQESSEESKPLLRNQRKVLMKNEGLQGAACIPDGPQKEDLAKPCNTGDPPLKDDQGGGQVSCNPIGKNCSPVPEPCLVPQDCRCLDQTDRKTLATMMSDCPTLNPSEHINSCDLAVAFLIGNIPLPPDIKCLVRTMMKNINSFIRLPDMLTDCEVAIDDAKRSRDDETDKKYQLLNRVITQQGKRLTVKFLIKSSVDETCLYRLFCDNFMSYLTAKRDQLKGNCTATATHSGVKL